MHKINGKYLRDLRAHYGYSLRTFADMIYASKSSVQRWERSFLPENANILESISAVFNISVEEMREQSAAKYGSSKTATPSPVELSTEEISKNGDDYLRNELNPTLFHELSSTVKWIAVLGAIAFILSFIFLFST